MSCTIDGTVLNYAPIYCITRSRVETALISRQYTLYTPCSALLTNMPSCKIINHQGLRAPSRFLQHNDHLFVKSHPALAGFAIFRTTRLLSGATPVNVARMRHEGRWGGCTGAGGRGEDLHAAFGEFVAALPRALSLAPGARSPGRRSRGARGRR